MREEEFEKNSDDLVRLVSKHHDEYVAWSTTNNKVRYEKKKKEKNNTKIKKAILIILASGLVIGITPKVVDTVSKAIEEENVDNEKVDALYKKLADPVTNNTIYNTKSLDSYGNPTYSYDMIAMADDLLKSNPDIDIDTRIYGAIVELSKKQYKTDEYIDKLFSWLNRLVSVNPEDYPLNSMDVTKYGSYTEYLEGKNMTEEEYKEFMSDIVKTYAYEDEETINDLLTQFNNYNTLNGGAR